jgi:hypothetical protein
VFRSGEWRSQEIQFEKTLVILAELNNGSGLLFGSFIQVDILSESIKGDG